MLCTGNVIEAWKLHFQNASFRFARLFIIMNQKLSTTAKLKSRQSKNFSWIAQIVVKREKFFVSQMESHTFSHGKMITCKNILWKWFFPHFFQCHLVQREEALNTIFPSQPLWQVLTLTREKVLFHGANPHPHWKSNCHFNSTPFSFANFSASSSSFLFNFLSCMTKEWVWGEIKKNKREEKVFHLKVFRFLCLFIVRWRRALISPLPCPILLPIIIFNVIERSILRLRQQIVEDAARSKARQAEHEKQAACGERHLQHGKQFRYAEQHQIECGENHSRPVSHAQWQQLAHHYARHEHQRWVEAHVEQHECANDNQILECLLIVAFRVEKDGEHDGKDAGEEARWQVENTSTHL